MARPSSPGKPITEHLAYLLAQANREINRQLDARFRDEGVPVEQWRILKVLSDGKGHSMGELAETVLLNHPTLTKMIDRMVTDALVYRAQDADDRRKVLMFISDRGKELTQRLNLLALRQEAHISENYGNKATSDLKRLLESLIEESELERRHQAAGAMSGGEQLDRHDGDRISFDLLRILRFPSCAGPP